MKNIEEEHVKVTHHLKNIKSAMNEMREEGLGGTDFEYMYLKARLIPLIIEIFESKSVKANEPHGAAIVFENGRLRTILD